MAVEDWDGKAARSRGTYSQSPHQGHRLGSKISHLCCLGKILLRVAYELYRVPPFTNPMRL